MSEMTKQLWKESTAVEGLLSELRPLLEQIGSSEGLVSLQSTVTTTIPQVRDEDSLGDFLEYYARRILLQIELPAIFEAYQRVHRFEVRELLELDARLTGEPLLRSFAEASEAVGMAQLNRLRPLRDQRLVQRYLLAVENGEARGWHTVVYGMVLSLYSLPARQGLLNYAEQTLRGLLRAAAEAHNISIRDRERLWDRIGQSLPVSVDTILAAKPLQAL